MTKSGYGAAPCTHWLMEQTELTQHCAAIIVDALSRQPVIGVELIDAAKREFDPSPCRRQAAPRPEMRTADDNLHDQSLGGLVPVLHLNCEIGQRAHELNVIRAHSVAASAMIPPRLVIVPCLGAKRRHQSFQVVAVLAPDVLLDDRSARLNAFSIEY